MNKKYYILSFVLLLTIAVSVYGAFIYQEREALKLQEKILEQKKPENIAKNRIIGLWNSVDDENFSREFINNTVIDYYNNEKKTEGIWIIVKGSDIPQDVKFEVDQNALYLIVSNTQAQVEGYKIGTLDSKRLVLYYLTTGNILTFNKNN